MNCVSFKRNIIYSAHGNLIGYLIIDVNEEIISKIYSKVKYGKTGKFMIVNANGDIISAYDKSELNKNISREEYFDWLKGNDRKGRVFDINGRKCLVSSRVFERTGWIIIGMVPIVEIMEDNVRVSMLIYLAGAVCILLGITASFFLSRTISKPIIRLSELMNHAGEGQLGVRIEADWKDETGMLARSFNKMLQKISNLMDMVYMEQKKKREYELGALQAQINPHFLYNTLESICSLIKLSWTEDALALVLTLGKFYRMVLNKGENIVSIKQEIDIITQYLTIQKVRYRDKLEYAIDVDERILHEKIIKLTIQPVVENAIYHGIKNKPDKGMVCVSGRIEGDMIIISVTDDGIGMDEDTVKNLFPDAGENQGNAGFGLRSVDERIKLHFGGDFGVRLESTPGKGTRVDILLPYNQDQA
jgi:two-component system sensor histidine kinase YesM